MRNSIVSLLVLLSSQALAAPADDVKVLLDQETDCVG